LFSLPTPGPCAEIGYHQIPVINLPLLLHPPVKAYRYVQNSYSTSVILNVLSFEHKPSRHVVMKKERGGGGGGGELGLKKKGKTGKTTIKNHKK